MKYIIKLTCPVLLTLSLSVHAGLDWTTVHSRANCINNESITWWYLHPYDWRVVSVHHHMSRNINHHIDTGFNYTWRAHAIHWAEPFQDLPWEVWGYHYLLGFSKNVPFDYTYAKNCNIIDGW